MTKTTKTDDLYTKYYDRVLAFFLARRCERALAEDMLQDVFMRYHRANYELDDIQARVTLFKIANSVFIDYLRKLRSQRSSGLAQEQTADIQTDVEVADETEDQHRALEAKQELGTVLARLQALPPKCREVFIDFRFRGLSQKDIAKRRKISVSMVEKHVASAIAKLKSDGES